MNIKDILSDTIKTKPPLFVNEYYINIYKKTEKVVCAVFLITDIKKNTKDIEDICTEARTSAKKSLFEIIELLSNDTLVPMGEVGSRLKSLMSLRSLLSVLASLRVVRGDLTDIVVREIDLVIQNIFSSYEERAKERVVSSAEHGPLYVEKEKLPKVRRHSNVPRISRVPEGLTDGGGGTRRDTILSVMRTKGVVSIKDIADSITDCSEKTIQRELMDMIKDNIIVREGERRWSKYSLLK